MQEPKKKTRMIRVLPVCADERSARAPRGLRKNYPDDGASYNLTKVERARTVKAAQDVMTFLYITAMLLQRKILLNSQRSTQLSLDALTQGRMYFFNGNDGTTDTSLHFI